MARHAVCSTILMLFCSAAAGWLGSGARGEERAAGVNVEELEFRAGAGNDLVVLTAEGFVVLEETTMLIEAESEYLPGPSSFDTLEIEARIETPVAEDVSLIGGARLEAPDDQTIAHGVAGFAFAPGDDLHFEATALLSRAPALRLEAERSFELSAAAELALFVDLIAPLASRAVKRRYDQHLRVEFGALAVVETETAAWFGGVTIDLFADEPSVAGVVGTATPISGDLTVTPRLGVELTVERRGALTRAPDVYEVFGDVGLRLGDDAVEPYLGARFERDAGAGANTLFLVGGLRLRF